MATISVTKISIKKVQEKMWAVTLNLRVINGGVDLINQNFTENHKNGYSIDYTANKFKAKMQKCIDDYKEEQQLYNSAQFDNAITTLQSQLVY